MKKKSTAKERAIWLMEHQDLWRDMHPDEDKKPWNDHNPVMDALIAEMRKANLYAEATAYWDVGISVEIQITRVAMEAV